VPRAPLARTAAPVAAVDPSCSFDLIVCRARPCGVRASAMAASAPPFLVGAVGCGGHTCALPRCCCAAAAPLLLSLHGRVHLQKVKVGVGGQPRCRRRGVRPYHRCEGWGWHWRPLSASPLPTRDGVLFVHSLVVLPALRHRNCCAALQLCWCVMLARRRRHVCCRSPLTLPILLSNSIPSSCNKSRVPSADAVQLSRAHGCACAIRWVTPARQYGLLHHGQQSYAPNVRAGEHRREVTRGERGRGATRTIGDGRDGWRDGRRDGGERSCISIPYLQHATGCASWGARIVTPPPQAPLAPPSPTSPSR
jgi:hypothetical protein